MYTEKAYKKRYSQTLHPEQKGGKTDFVDKRPNLIAQTKLIYSIQNNHSKLSVPGNENNESFNKSETLGKEGVNQMKFNEHKVGYGAYTEAGVAYDRRLNYFLQNGRGYFVNLANIIGSDSVYMGANSHGHSEEKILADKNKGVVGLTTLTAKETAAQQGGKIDLDIYTELQPCNGNYGTLFNCDRLLDLALTDSSTVYYSFDRTQNLDSINTETKKKVVIRFKDSLIDLAYSDYETIKLLRMEIGDNSLGYQALDNLSNEIMRCNDDWLIANYSQARQVVIDRKNMIFRNIQSHYNAIQQGLNELDG